MLRGPGGPAPNDARPRRAGAGPAVRHRSVVRRRGTRNRHAGGGPCTASRSAVESAKPLCWWAPSRASSGWLRHATRCAGIVTATAWNVEARAAAASLLTHRRHVADVRLGCRCRHCSRCERSHRPARGPRRLAQQSAGAARADLSPQHRGRQRYRCRDLDHAPRRRLGGSAHGDPLRRQLHLGQSRRHHPHHLALRHRAGPGRPGPRDRNLRARFRVIRRDLRDSHQLPLVDRQVDGDRKRSDRQPSHPRDDRRGGCARGDRPHRQLHQPGRLSTPAGADRSAYFASHAPRQRKKRRQF